VDVAEDDEHPVVRRQNAHEKVSHSEGICGIRAVVAATAKAVESRTCPAKSAQREERTVASDSEEPRSRVLDRSQLGATLDRDEQSLLQDVLGEKAITHDLHEKPAEGVLGDPDERLEAAGFLRRGPSLESSFYLHVNTFPVGRLL
jgi:hypothetical protein